MDQTVKGVFVPAQTVSKKPKILVIDTDEDVQKNLKRHLEAAGFRVSQALSWRKAVDLSASESPDLIVLEIELDRSEICGIDLIHMFKKIRNLPAPILIYTGHSEKVVEALDEGASIFIPKSTPPAEVVPAILALIGGTVPIPPGN